MQNDETLKAAKVWGVMIPVSSSGRRKWPAEIKAMACDQIRSGTKIKDIALEIGANQSLVAKWKDQEGTSISSGFVEVVHAETDTVQDLRLQEGVATSCDIHVGDTKIAVPVGYPSRHLVDILRAVRVSQ